MGNTIYASFNDPALAEKAAGALLDHSVRAEDISVIRSHEGSAQVNTYVPLTAPVSDVNPMGINPNLGAETAAENYRAADERRTEIADRDSIKDDTVFHASTYDSSASTESAAKHGLSTTTSADAGVAAVKGAEWGAGLGIVATMAALIVPGFGIVLGAGTLAAAIGSVVATAGAGAIAGAVTGYLKDQGMDQAVATAYESTVTGGGAILAVTLPSGNVDEIAAKEILSKYGAVNTSAYVTRPSGYVA